MKIIDAVKTGKKILNDSLAVNVLLAHVLEVNKEYLITHSEEKIDEKRCEKFVSIIARHSRGEPLSHLTGVKEFFGLDFYVNRNVLIPRPETEHLVEKIIELVNRDFAGRNISVLDVGTGSGNIAVSIARNIAGSQVTASDVSREALEVAEINVKKHGLENQIKLIQSDLLTDITGKFDIIVANLPYIGKKENNFIAFEVENFEPHIALFGGDDGTELYERLFKQINEKKYLKHYLLGEIGFSQKPAMEKLLFKFFPKSKFQFFQDLAGFDRYFVVNYKS